MVPLLKNPEDLDVQHALLHARLIKIITMIATHVPIGYHQDRTDIACLNRSLGILMDLAIWYLFVLCLLILFHVQPPPGIERSFLSNMVFTVRGIAI